MTALLHPGDLVRVEPQDDDDPYALFLQGRHGEFIEYRTSPAGTVFAKVQFEGRSKPLAMRIQDIVSAGEIADAYRA